MSTRFFSPLKLLFGALFFVTFAANAQTTPTAVRAVDGLQALYLFDSGTGDLVYDRSGADQPLDLTISDINRIRWDENGLTLTEPVVVKSLGSTERLTQAISSTNEVTLEAWVTPESISQSGPARIVSLSKGTSDRNVTLGQIEPVNGQGSIFDLRLRTTFSGSNGLRPPAPQLSSFNSSEMSHVLFTKDASGMTSFYINGEKIEDSLTLGDFSNWDASFSLLLGNELSENRPWLGSLHLVALYNRALTSDEVTSNYNAGPDTSQTGGQLVSQQSSRTIVRELAEPESIEPALSSTLAISSSTPPPVASGSWPNNADGNLPLGGVFYGNPIAGISTGNVAIGAENSRRFRAERTGQIKSVRFHNRVLTDDNIESRCRSSGPESVWCTCVSKNLDSYACGYTLGNSYSVGNGGNISIELRPDDGSGLPSDTVLGKTRSYVPKDFFPNRVISLDFTDPASLQAGEIYHMVHTNSNPPSGCSLSGVDPSEAGACPRDQGAVGLNGVFNPTTPTSTGQFGPYRGTLGTANLFRRSVTGDWRNYQSSASFYELTYSDGVSVGDTYHAYDASGAGRKVIGGSVVARQRFDVQDATRKVDGLWVNFGHTSSSNGSPLDIKLQDDSGNTLATASIPASDHCLELAQGSSFADENCKDWGYSDLSASVNLLEGMRYYVELSSSSTNNFVLSALQPLPGGEFTDRNQWNGAWAQISTDSGRNWSQWAPGTSAETERDLSLLFTISGMPRFLD